MKQTIYRTTDWSFQRSCALKATTAICSNKCRCPAIMRYLQEIAGDHLSCLDLPYEKLFSDGVVFLLSGLEIHVYTPPVLWQDITLSTWSYGIKGATFTRNSRICDKKGSTLVEASAGWFLANPQTHRIVRPKDYPPVLAIPGKSRSGLFKRTVSHKQTGRCKKALRPEGAFFRRRLQPTSQQHKIR